MGRKPPHIVVTTPESLYVLLGLGVRAARCWRPRRTVIVDEIHAIARNKRGSHLALSLERPRRRSCGDRLLRIGLSATQNPIEAVARFLHRRRRLRHRRSAAIVATATSPSKCPDSPLEAVMSTDVWSRSIAAWRRWSASTAPR